MTVTISGTTPGIAVDGTGAVVNVTVTTGAGGGGGGVALGETSTTAYRGDRGKTAYDHSQVTTGNPHGTTAADVGADPAGTAAGLVDDLSGVSNQATARTNLGLGSAAVEDASAFATAAQGVDARTPTAHKTSHENGGSDELALDASQITSGTVAQDRLGTGSAGAGAKFLADDQTYKTVTSGIADPGGANDDFLQRKAGAWAARTVAQVKTDLGVVAQTTVIHPVTAGYYITTPYPINVGGTAGGNVATAHTRLVCSPNIIITKSVTIDRLAIVVTNAGDASSVLRLGLWADNGSQRPGTLLAQGTVAGDSTGVKLATVSLTLTPGIYWTGLAWQGGVPTTQPKWQCLNHGAQVMGANFGAVDLVNSTRTRNWLYQNTVTGSFSSSPTLTETPAQTAALDVTVPEIALRVA